MLPDEDSVNPDRSMHLSLQGWIDRFEDRGEFAYDYINRATATDYRLKKHMSILVIQAYLSPSFQLGKHEEAKQLTK